MVDLKKLRLRMLRPLPKTLRGAVCDWCDKAQSSWCAETPLSEEDRVYVCSLCVLYRAEWAHKRNDIVASMAVDVEKARNEEFERDDSARLTRALEADHVLGVLVLMDRLGSFYKVADSLKGSDK